AIGLVRPRGAADEAGAVGSVRDVLGVTRDARPVGVQRELGLGVRACAVVDVLQMAPQPMLVSSILACAADAEIRLGAVNDDEPAAGQEVAVSICRAACKREGERRGAERKTCPNCTHDHYSV